MGENKREEHERVEEIRARIARLEARLEDLRRRFPAHSIPPAMVAEMDALEEELEDVRQLLEQIESSPPTDEG